MRKFLFKTLLGFALIFITFFGITMFLEYKNKDKINSEVNVKVEVIDGEIQLPKTPDKVQANYEFSKSYFYLGYVIVIIIPLLFKAYGGIEVIKNRNFKHKWTEGLALSFLFLLFSWILTLPKSFFSGFYRARLVGLTNESFYNYITSNIVDNSIDIITTLPILMIFYLIYLKFDKWYFIVGIITIGLYIGGNYIYPYLDEIQNNLAPMEDGVIKEKVLKLAGNVGIKNLEVMVIPKSEETNSINAYMTGMGRSRRIVFWDTTLKQLNEQEIISVAAHEMGHYKLKHIQKSMVLSILTSFMAVILLNAIMEKREGKIYRNIDNLPKLIFILNIITLFITPIELAYSRKIETEADKFAIEKTGDYYTNGALEIKFIESNLSPVDVDKLYKYFAYSHPTTKERIELSNSYAH
ncbi:MAG: M48 family metallopeptidase [Clostridium sp.]